MVDEIIAKSSPKKNLMEHTIEVLENFKKLKSLKDKLKIPLEEEDWYILEKACFYHDFGKANPDFQNKIRKIQSKDEIPHNFLSLFFIEEENDLLLKIVAFSHWREPLCVSLKDKKLNEIYNEISEKYLPKLKEYFKKDFILIKLGFFVKRMEKLNKYYFKRLNGYVDLKEELRFIILLGILNRIDHSASAGVPVEIEPLNKYLKIKKFLFTKSSNPWQLLELKEDYKNKNGIVIASTGMGKTELSLLWGDSHKTFYTLPVRTSVTAMYKRLSEIFGKNNVGLLHCEALSVLFFNEKKSSSDDAFYLYDMAKNLSYPLIISTADQLFSATLKYLGFEKIYATLSYSKIIIDEIQAYSPQTMAIIIHGLEEITSIGGKFIIVTATFPSFIKEKLNFDFCIKKIPNLKKHRVKLLHESLSEENTGSLKSLLSKLCRNGIKKILITCNTVERAQSLYKALEKFSPILLHSRFTRVDRTYIEDTILEKRKKFEGILISTQIIEVSLDIDFDVLITEMAPLDVLVQRMGRVYRRFKNDGEFCSLEPNVYIFMEDVSGVGKVYEREIIQSSKFFLRDGVISEEEKYQIVKDFYSEENLKNTNYLVKFHNAIKAVKYYSVTKKEEAQQIFRDISQIEILPASLLNEEPPNERILYKLGFEKRSPLIKILEKIKIKNKEDKILLSELIKDFMLPLPLYRIKSGSLTSLGDYITNNEIKDFLTQVKVINYKYDKRLGILYEKSENNIL